MNRTKKSPPATGKCQRIGAVLLPVCSFCGEVPARGIKGVVRVGKAWLCQTCEGKIIRLEVGSNDYETMLAKMKRVWQ
ncbi:MAG TPA: sigma factor G inhibitor Gin [Syntrophomonadaceae bacterium]|jgi:hypothetical protein|nr:sigma factor G inhibitor Gin [Syntrophomonadaceae bacterium]